MRVTTTYNGGPRTYELGKQTLVIGGTGAGKSALIASLGLLLTGSADDAVGRQEVAATADLALAMPEAADEIGVTLEHQGRTFSYLLQRGKKPVVDLNQHANRHPVRVIRDILASGPDTARRELAPMLLGDAMIPVRRLVPVQIAELLPEEMDAGALVQRLQKEDTEVKALEKKRRELEKSVSLSEQTLPQRPAPEIMQAARAAAQGVQEAYYAQRDRVIEYQRQVAAQTRWEQEVAALRQQAANLGAAWQAAPESLPGVLTGEQTVVLDAYVRILALAPNADTCPLCKGHADVTALKSKIEAYLAGDAQARLQQEQKTKADILPQYQACGARIKAMLAEPPLDPGPYPGEIPEGNNEPLKLVAALDAAEHQWVQITRVRSELLVLQQRVAQRELLVAELKRLLETVYRERTAAIEDAVSRWLPAGWRLSLVIETSRFRLGLRDPSGAWVGNPSGGQRAALLLALTVHLLSEGCLSAPDGPQILMLPEERGCSPKWLQSIMTALADADFPVILCSLTKGGRTPRGWKVLELDEPAPVKVAEGLTEDDSISPASPAPGV